MSEVDIRGNFLALKGALAADDEATARDAALGIVEDLCVALWRFCEVMHEDGKAREAERQAIEREKRDLEGTRRARGW